MQYSAVRQFIGVWSGVRGTLANRGTLEVAVHNDDAAVADFNAALARNPNLAPAYMSRGAVMLRTGRYDEARADFTRAIDLGAPDLHVAYFNRGEAQEASGNLVAAYHDYRKAQELAPDFTPASQELARFQVESRSVCPAVQRKSHADRLNAQESKFFSREPAENCREPQRPFR